MSLHTMKRFDEELSDLKERILTMGGLVEQAVNDAVQALLTQNEQLAVATIDRDKAINALEVQCDEMTRDIIVRRQPAATDLRFLIASTKVVTDLERMGDLASGIASGMLHTLENPPKHLSTLDTMSNKVTQQVNRALDALTRGDITLALKVIEKDKRVDDLYKTIYRETLTYMLEDTRSISSAIVLSNIAKNLERIADHATNIAEMVIYIIKGHDIRHVDHKTASKLLKPKAE